MESSGSNATPTRNNCRAKINNNKYWYCPGCLEYPEPTQPCGWCWYPYCTDCLIICNECRVQYCPTCYEKHDSYASEEEDEADETDIEEDEDEDEADETDKDACEMPQEF